MSNPFFFFFFFFFIHSFPKKKKNNNINKNCSQDPDNDQILSKFEAFRLKLVELGVKGVPSVVTAMEKKRFPIVSSKAEVRIEKKKIKKIKYIKIKITTKIKIKIK